MFDILVDDLDGVRVITIRRPDALNALHDELNDEILSAIRAGEADPAIEGFVIIGFGTRAFSAGAELGRFRGLLGDALAAAHYARACSRLLVYLDAMAKPVVAALNGMALGGGLEFAIRSHGIVAMHGASLQFPEITWGSCRASAPSSFLIVVGRTPPQLVHRMLRSAERVGPTMPNGSASSTLASSATGYSRVRFRWRRSSPSGRAGT